MTAATKYADHNREPFRTWLELRPMRALILFALACQLIFACGGGGGETGFVYIPEPAAPAYTETVTEWTVIGDSTGNHFAQRWPGEVTNYARNGARIDLFLSHPPPNVFQKVILMVGGNNVGLNNESVDTVVEKYALLYWSIRAERVFCVGITPFQGEDGFSPAKNPRIQEINEHIKGLCGDGYIDTWPPEMTPSFTDGVHHTADYDRQIREAILSGPYSIHQSSY